MKFLNMFCLHTGCISQIWTEIQVDIHLIYIASTETNDTSKESSDTQLFAGGKFEGVALSRGLHAHLPQKDIEKKVNLTEESQDAKKKFFNRANLILIL